MLLPFASLSLADQLVQAVAISAEEQLEFPVLYASAKEGWASPTFSKGPTGERSMGPLLDAIIKHVPPPKGNLCSPFQMLVRINHPQYVCT